MRANKRMQYMIYSLNEETIKNIVLLFCNKCETSSRTSTVTEQRVFLVAGSEDEVTSPSHSKFVGRRSTSEDHTHVPGRGSPRRRYYHNRARNKHWHDPMRCRDIAHGKGSYRRLPAVARCPRTKRHRDP